MVVHFYNQYLLDIQSCRMSLLNKMLQLSIQILGQMACKTHT
jgi:hypothetical protein